jgi:hypothetical protein
MIVLGLWRRWGQQNCSEIAVNVVHVVHNHVFCAPRKYHARLRIVVTCGQFWTIENGKFAASSRNTRHQCTITHLIWIAGRLQS